MSKVPCGMGLAMSRIPGWVLPGPFGSLASVAVVDVVFADVVDDGAVGGGWCVAAGALGGGVPVAIGGADRGKAGASRNTVTAETQRPATKITPIARRSPVGDGRRPTVILSTAAPPVAIG
jgi:hypothetical protein